MTEWVEKVLKKSKWVGDCLEFNGAKDSSGYGHITLGGKTKSIHRLSYEHSKGEIPEDLVVRHTCDNPSCWNPEHLLVGTRKDNSQDMSLRIRSTKGYSYPSKIGHTYTQGSSNGRSKLTEDQVKEIKELLSLRVLSQKHLAQEFNVSRATINHIKNNISWSHV